MADSESPLVYLILGAPGSGRRAVLSDLIDGSREAGDHPAVLLSEGEAADPYDAKLPGVGRWLWSEGAIGADWPVGATHVYFVTEGRRDPVEQVEAFQTWLQSKGRTLTRVLTVVNCKLAEKNHPALLPWYGACVHFSDVVLLNRREGVANKWFSDFLKHFEKLYYPCLFEIVKDGRVRNPLLVLAPEARRMTHVFDEERPAWAMADGIDKDTIIVDEGDDEDDEGEESSDEEEEAEVEEPYFVRDAAGRRKKRIPDIGKFLG